MNRQLFLLTALAKSTAYYKAKWVFSLLTVVRESDVSNMNDSYDYQIATQDGKYVYWLNDQWNIITDSPTIDRPLWTVEEMVEIPNQSLLVQPHNKFPFKTRVGTLFLNYYCLVSAFGDRIEYQDGKLNIRNLEKLVVSRLKDRDPNGTTDPKAVYPDEVKKFGSAVQATAGFASIAAPGATAYTMQGAPGIKEYRDQLLEQYKDKLTDPAIVALIDKKLVEYDKAYQAQDPEGGFYISDKAFKVSRKKMHSMHGLEQPEISGGKRTLIVRSLSEGWDPKDLPAMIDSMRDGSYNRGAMTALGGEEVKFIFRIFSTSKITEEDCGTKLGIPLKLTRDNIKTYEGNTIILKDGKQVKLDSSNMSQYIGQSVMVRSPGTCCAEHANFCFTCLGERLRSSESALAALASEVGSKMLDIFMAKMHGVALQTTPWNIEDTLS